MRKMARWLQFNLMYLSRPPWDSGLSPPELLKFIGTHAPGNAIDLGCGTGTNLLTLAKAGWTVTGVDFALKAVMAARRRLSREGISGEVRAGDVSRLELVQGSYDLVLDIGCYHGLDQPSRESYRNNLSAIMKPEAHYLLYAHLQDADNAGGYGLNQADIDAFQTQMTLTSRADGGDPTGRASTWLSFQNRAAA